MKQKKLLSLLSIFLLSFVNTIPLISCKNITKLSNKFPKLHRKETKLNKVLKKHNDKSDTRTKKWEAKDAKKQEKEKKYF